MAAPVVDPPTPYTALIPGGFFPGKMIRIQGIVPMHGQRFDINLQCGAGGELAGEDVAFHASVRLSENYVARNSFQSGCWQEELGDGAMPIYPGQNFEVLLLCETYEYKMAVNGQHFCSFPLRVPYTHVSHLMLEGDVKINLISWEGSGASAPPINGPGYGVAPPQYVPPSNAAYGQPAPGGAYTAVTQIPTTQNIPQNRWYHQNRWYNPYGYYRRDSKQTCWISIVFLLIFFALVGGMFYLFFHLASDAEKKHEEFRDKYFLPKN